MHRVVHWQHSTVWFTWREPLRCRSPVKDLHISVLVVPLMRVLQRPRCSQMACSMVWTADDSAGEHWQIVLWYRPRANTHRLPRAHSVATSLSCGVYLSIYLSWLILVCIMYTFLLKICEKLNLNKHSMRYYGYRGALKRSFAPKIEI